MAQAVEDGAEPERNDAASEGPLFSEEEKIQARRWGLRLVLLGLAGAECWYGWTLRSHPDFDVVAYAANATTVLINVTALWWLIFGLRTIIEYVVEVAIFVWRRAMSLPNRVFPKFGRRSTGAAQGRATRSFRRALEGITAPLFLRRQTKERRRYTFQIGPRLLASLGFIIAIVIGLTADRLTIRPPPAEVGEKPSEVSGASISPIEHCVGDVSKLSCRLQPDENPTTLARRISDLPTCPDLLWKKYLAANPKAIDRKISPNAAFEFPDECLGSHARFGKA